MSTGLVICSVCHHEVHEDQRGWYHCDGGMICNGGRAIYPENVSEIQGKWCGRDDMSRTMIQRAGLKVQAPRIMIQNAGVKLPDWLKKLTKG